MWYTYNRLHTLRSDTGHADFTVWCKACLAETLIALCERVCYPNHTYKN